MKMIEISIWLMLCTTFAMAQQRAIDGRNNNLSYPDWGASNTSLGQITPSSFADGISAPAGANRPNPRHISNVLFAQENDLLDDLNRSAFVWSFGQFIDHDITLVPGSSELLPISVPQNDPMFDPFNTGTAIIPMTRSAYDSDSGGNSTGPRKYINTITAWIDGSGVYGSDQERADWLRTFKDGKLKTSTGNLLPFNTFNNERKTPVNQEAPEMEVPTQSNTPVFVAGDARANENPILLAFHTLFLREHNRLCDELKKNGSSDEELYQAARHKVIALIQAITYEEWLPAMGIILEPYLGYNPEIDPRITNVFSAAAFRFGHSLINEQILMMDNQGTFMDPAEMLLREAFFDPIDIYIHGGVEVFFKGLSTQVQQRLDTKIVDGLRNFLFGLPGKGGLDLAAININRGRERGLADYNGIRNALGLQEVDFFSEITNQADVVIALESLYEDINDVDPWVGMLAEKHLPNALFGETIHAIMTHQFSALRDGDRFYYENDLEFTEEEKKEIKHTSLSDLIIRNTNLTCLQENVFFAIPHIETCWKNVPTGIQHLAITAFPNPMTAEGYFVINSKYEKKAIFQLTDPNGRQVLQKSLHLLEGKNLLYFDDLGDLPKGVYFAMVQMEENVELQKIIKW